MQLSNFVKEKLQSIRIYYKEKKEEAKVVWKNFKAKTKKRFKKIVSWTVSIDIDWLFIFFASYILSYQYEVWHRIWFSIGLSYVYKYMIIQKVKELVMVNKRQ